MHCGAEEAYNAGMGTISASELDAWLSAGGLVVTASERAARAMLRAYHRARQSEGRTAWIAPSVTHWQAFVRDAWEKSARDGRLVLSPQQELLLWRRIVAASQLPAAMLDGPRRKLAGLAMEAHARICAFAPQYLDARRRHGWDQDAAAWSGWLEDFDTACRDCAAVSAERIALELPGLLDEREQRPPIAAGRGRPAYPVTARRSGRVGRVAAGCGRRAGGKRSLLSRRRCELRIGGMRGMVPAGYRKRAGAAGAGNCAECSGAARRDRARLSA